MLNTNFYSALLTQWLLNYTYSFKYAMSFHWYRLKHWYNNARSSGAWSILPKKAFSSVAGALSSDFRLFFLKKYFYTVNHKRIALNYFYFSMWTAGSGSALATMIRLEMAYPGSPFFKGDSLRYLQVMTAHALIMIFFMVVPVIFGGFANFLLPYHVGSKDVAFPRLNSLGFWLQPSGYLLVAKIGFIRQQYWQYYDKPSYYFSMISPSTNQFSGESINQALSSSTIGWGPAGKSAPYLSAPYIPFYSSLNHPDDYNFSFYKKLLSRSSELSYFAYPKAHPSSPRLLLIDFSFLAKDSLFARIRDSLPAKVSSYLPLPGLPSVSSLHQFFIEIVSSKLAKVALAATLPSHHCVDSAASNVSQYAQAPQFSALGSPLRLLVWSHTNSYAESFWYLASRASSLRRRKRFVAKCSSFNQTVAGWTFITPFSSNTKYTGVGVQDMLITGVYYVGISTTISIVNLLVTRRVLTIPGLRSRRILLPFPTITILLMLRALAVITPVLGSSMLMLLLDRHWKTSFFDFSYGGDPILFHHLFWFFGHPEVYVLVIPAFGLINIILPSANTRRVASKHHLVWAIYVMNYMGFLVWGHHMYLIGLDHRSRALYSTITIMISLPATIKVVNWTLTLLNGFIRPDAAFFASISFIFFFLVAGFTGMWLSHVSLNISMHDSMYVVAHFHLMLSGAVIMAIFAGFYFYFSSLFGLKYSRTWAYLHIIYYTAGQWLTFLPLFWVSFSGLPRRLHDFPAIYTGWQSMATVGHMITMLGVFCFYICIFDSHKHKINPVSPSFMIPRLNRRVLYYLFKISYFSHYLSRTQSVPSFKARKTILLNGFSSAELEAYTVTLKYRW